MNEENILEKIQELRADTSKISCYQNGQNKVLEEIQKEISDLRSLIEETQRVQQTGLTHVITEMKFFDETQKDILRAFDALNGSDWKKYNKIKEILSDNQ